ncbi:predicted protein [Chaetoceros tenuissimus]|uniref:RRM Nup35-type domain-containing protein n=1 Tax=Chaetoceros tenuissimus TaxID=426638 RepID=A0AAD3DCI2_9STRA|nr:predicted protein [Chaetoceros tenuissimus]
MSSFSFGTATANPPTSSFSFGAPSQDKDNQQRQQQSSNSTGSNIYQNSAVNTPPNTTGGFGNSDSNVFQQKVASPRNLMNTNTNPTMNSSTNESSNLFGSSSGKPFSSSHQDHSSLFGRPTISTQLSTPTFGLSNSTSTQTNTFLSQSTSLGGGLASSASLGLRQRNVGEVNSQNRVHIPKRSMMSMTTEKQFNSKPAASTNIMNDKENQHMNILNSSISTSLVAKPSTAGLGNNISSSSAHLQSINYNQWVVLYGFSTMEQYTFMLEKFDKLGTITRKYPSTAFASNDSALSSNWVCIQYESALQADKAMCQNSSILNMIGGSDSFIVGVMKVDEIIARKLGLKQFLHNGGEEEKSKKTFFGKRDEARPPIGISTSLNEKDVLLNGNDVADRRLLGLDGTNTAPRQGSVCYKLLAWVYGW